MRRKRDSSWLPEITRDTGSVLSVSSVKALLSKAKAGIGLSKGSSVQPNCLARPSSIKLSSAPELIRACKGNTTLQEHCALTNS